MTNKIICSFAVLLFIAVFNFQASEATHKSFGYLFDGISNFYFASGTDRYWEIFQSFTVGVFIKLDANTPNIPGAGIVTVLPDGPPPTFLTNAGWGFLIGDAPNKIIFHCQHAGGHNNLSTTISVGEWVHIAVVHKAPEKVTQMFVNGRLAATSLLTFDAAVVYSPLIASLYVGRNTFKGIIDEISIRSFPLSPAEVLANRDICTLTTLDFYSPFSHTSGTRAYTQSLIYAPGTLNDGGNQNNWVNTCPPPDISACCVPIVTVAVACNPEICNDNIDNDCDGSVDCSDTNCYNTPNCICDNSCRNSNGCPDIILDDNRLKTSLEQIVRTFTADSCAFLEGCVGGLGARKLLRFDTVTPNIGRTALDLGIPSEPAFHFDTCHRHYHFKGYAKYDILNSLNVTVGVGSKQAFCLLDSIVWNNTILDAGGHSCNFQGLGRGWADVYPKEIDCQWIDITDLSGGNYLLRIEINSAGADGCRSFIEENYVNNIYYIPFTISTVGACSVCSGFYKTLVAPAANTSDDATNIFSYTDPISNSHTVYNPGDDGTIVVNLPFDFPFYCQKYNKVNVNANGFLSVASITGSTYNEAATPNECWPNGICVLWDDWNPSAAGAIYVGTTSQYAIITWYRVVHYGGSITDDLFTFQAVLLPSGNVRLFYPDVTSVNTMFNRGISATVGIQGQTNKDNVIYAYHNGTMNNGDAVEFKIAKSTKPVASGGGPYYGTVGVPVIFNASASFDQENDRMEFNWNFGDSSDAPSNDPTPSHIFKAPGVYNVYLFVSDFPLCSPGQNSDFYWTTATITTASYCGNGICETNSNENVCSCPADCGSISCGDGICCRTAGESVCTCPGDCGASTCGDGICCPASGENHCSCPRDCGASTCGDGICCTADLEDSCSCTTDCGASACGDGICCGSGGENTCTCQQDCGKGYKGDGVCCAALLEDKCTSPTDCQALATSCCRPGALCAAGSDCCSGTCLLNGRCSTSV